MFDRNRAASQEMEALLVKHLIPSTYANPSARRHFGNSTSEDSKLLHNLPVQWGVNKHMHFSHFTTRSKRAPIQDFQDFANPSRLLQTTRAKLQTKYVPEDVLSSLELDISSSYYMVELCTSKDFGSGLRDVNAAILLCLIDVNGDALLQRLSAVTLDHSMQGKDMVSDEAVHFQRGSVDIVTFKGSKLGKIEAFWIGLESGQSLSQTPLLNKQTTKEDSMREYGDLKFSLLVYDLILISSGSSILNFTTNEKAAYAFLAGGMGGFLYLLLLQRSADGLSAPGNQSENGENLLQAFGGFKRQWLTLALVIALGSTVLKYQIGGTNMALSPTELFIGVAGFLTSKIAVVLAAFRPFQRNSKNK
ncbi:hypothetical protein OPV22_012528 [Ensete ventricosum]|uniref:DUF7755 domain-containing protein n=1 Tax=Ensete ventricosum TaxID=4639 RepID=A0AAV8QTH2_ENSVE|nr:hypothetical protein OPV22_012528 [Ensete ventricosum]